MWASQYHTPTFEEHDQNIGTMIFYSPPDKIVVLSLVLSQVMRPCCLSKADIPPKAETSSFQYANLQPTASPMQT